MTESKRTVALYARVFGVGQGQYHPSTAKNLLLRAGIVG